MDLTHSDVPLGLGSVPTLDMDRLARLAVSKGIPSYPIRSLCWRVWLGVLPSSGSMATWLEQTGSDRAEYRRSVQYLETMDNIVRHSTHSDPEENQEDLFLERAGISVGADVPSVTTDVSDHATDTDTDPLGAASGDEGAGDESDGVPIDNPLSDAEDSAFKAAYELQKLKDLIQRDLDRVFRTNGFFSMATTQKALSNILTIVCSSPEMEELSYRQGMHEVCAVVYHALTRAAMACERVRTLSVPEPSPPTSSASGYPSLSPTPLKAGFTRRGDPLEAGLLSLCDLEEVEADTCAILRKLLGYIGGWYKSDTGPTKQIPQVQAALQLYSAHGGIGVLAYAQAGPSCPTLPNKDLALHWDCMCQQARHRVLFQLQRVPNRGRERETGPAVGERDSVSVSRGPPTPAERGRERERERHTPALPPHTLHLEGGGVIMLERPHYYRDYGDSALTATPSLSATPYLPPIPLPTFGVVGGDDARSASKSAATGSGDAHVPTPCTAGRERVGENEELRPRRGAERESGSKYDHHATRCCERECVQQFDTYLRVFKSRSVRGYSYSAEDKCVADLPAYRLSHAFLGEYATLAERGCTYRDKMAFMVKWMLDSPRSDAMTESHFTRYIHPLSCPCDTGISHIMRVPVSIVTLMRRNQHSVPLSLSPSPPPSPSVCEESASLSHSSCQERERESADTETSGSVLDFCHSSSETGSSSLSPSSSYDESSAYSSLEPPPLPDDIARLILPTATSAPVRVLSSAAHDTPSPPTTPTGISRPSSSKTLTLQEEHDRGLALLDGYTNPAYDTDTDAKEAVLLALRGFNMGISVGLAKVDLGRAKRCFVTDWLLDSDRKPRIDIISAYKLLRCSERTIGYVMRGGSPKRARIVLDEHGVPTPCKKGVGEQVDEGSTGEVRGGIRQRPRRGVRRRDRPKRGDRERERPKRGEKERERETIVRLTEAEPHAYEHRGRVYNERGLPVCGVWTTQGTPCMRTEYCRWHKDKEEVPVVSPEKVVSLIGTLPRLRRSRKCREGVSPKRRVPFTSDERKAVKAALEKYGPKQVVKIAACLPGRTYKQVYKYLRNDDARNRKTHTVSRLQEERRIAIRGVRKYGRSGYREVAETLPGRTPNQVYQYIGRKVIPLLKAGGYSETGEDNDGDTGGNGADAQTMRRRPKRKCSAWGASRVSRPPAVPVSVPEVSDTDSDTDSDSDSGSGSGSGSDTPSVVSICDSCDNSPVPPSVETGATSSGGVDPEPVESVFSLDSGSDTDSETEEDSATEAEAESATEGERESEAESEAESESGTESETEVESEEDEC
ncbi:hypothetical protein KIPB_004737 [Kipferlia bialata]|uniref:HTH myb-type domain-containing protein n=1 Tax=Kipferlia bialata TaxID=797122 RepID=A0A9K3CXF4_9EUKA|nr:hypothetical protein KIPB_004737 [Kipferlia bialata]|eukprot:g4737.t1